MFILSIKDDVGKCPVKAEIKSNHYNEARTVCTARVTACPSGGLHLHA